MIRKGCVLKPVALTHSDGAGDGDGCSPRVDNDHIGVEATGGGQSGSVAAGASAVGWSAGQGWTVAGHVHAAACGTLKPWEQSRVINTAYGEIPL